MPAPASTSPLPARMSRALWLAAGFACLSGGVAAEDGVGPWVAADEAEVRLVSSVGAIAPGVGRVLFGVQVRLNEGWRIYWRTPGAAGLPPQFDWSGSANLDEIALRWPAPKRFEAFGQQSYGYAGEVLFPATATLARPGEPLALRLAFAYLVCREVCMPGEASLALDLASGPAVPTSVAGEISRHAARVPAEAETIGISIGASTGPQGLTVTARGRDPFRSPDVFVEWPVAAGQRRPDLPKPELALAEHGREARFRIGVHAPLVPPGTQIRVTVTDGASAVEAMVTVEPAGR